jgi:NAD(P)-dependent dehydrogenase (short-subunit alcohol dehydrogenase family)
MAPYAASKAGVEAFGDSLRCELKRLDVDVGVAYFGFIDTDMVRGADAHPAIAILNRNRGPLSKTYPVSAVGKAVVEGMQKRSRWIVVPGWARVLIGLGRLVQPIIERGSYDDAATVDQAFREDIERRGAEAASAPIGAGGEAVSASDREHAGST